MKKDYFKIKSIYNSVEKLDAFRSRLRANKKLRTAAKVGDVAVTGLSGVLRLAVKTLLSGILILITALLLFSVIFAYYVKNTLSTDLNITLDDYKLSLSSTIWGYDDSGNLTELAVLQSSENRVWVNYDELPEYLEKAAVAIEDKRFYEHKGVDWYRTTGAFVNMFLGMKNDFGGSTITQQLIKNLTEEDDVTVQRKLSEIFRALDLEKAYTKEEIMEWYLNAVYFGEGAYGVQVASQTYFGKSVQNLDLAQCASIIGITNNPSRYSPFASTENNKVRTKIILYEMYDQGFITRGEYQLAVEEVDNDELHFVRGENEVYSQEIYSYYVEMVINDVLADLQSKMGLSKDAATTLLYHGGYQVYTCLDARIQSVVDDVFSRPEDFPKPWYDNGQQLKSGCVVLDPYTGDILAIGGGVGQKTKNLIFNYATDAHRPAGSSAKPLAVYAPAMDLGIITESTLVNDSPDVTLRGTTWYPRNSGTEYMGIITIWDALVYSKNTVAAQIMDLLTPSVSYEYMTKRMGFRLEPEDEDYAPLSLGQFTNGVTVREMAQAYSVFPNDGVMSYARSYSKVTDSNGVIVLDNSTRQSSVFDANTARCMTEMLEAAAWYGTGYEAYLGWGNMPVAGKTGTTSDDYDRWFCGFSPYYVCCVWTGYDNPSNMYFGGNPAAQIWKEIMNPINSGLPLVEFADPAYRGYDTGVFGATPTPTPTPEVTPEPTPDWYEDDDYDYDGPEAIPEFTPEP